MNAAFSPELEGVLSLASQAYRRHDDDVFRELLLKAIRLAPHRLDLRLNLGNHYIQCALVDTALSVFAEPLDSHPGDPELLTRLAHWWRYSGDHVEAEKRMARLRAVRPERASDLARIWSNIDARLALPVGDVLPDLPPDSEGVVVVALGLVLNPDGTMRPGLVDRLEKTLDAANRFRDSRIIVSGGVPRAGMIEARAMRDWLIRRGVDADRIHEEGYARDLVENFLYSRHILDRLRAKTAVIITSANNVRRAGAALEIIAWAGGSAWRVPSATAASCEATARFVDDGSDRLKLYRDSLRAYGLPMMRTYPGLVEL